ncbi:hypothetical protein LCGC14_2150690, partial [marine sediment metagenome]
DHDQTTNFVTNEHFTEASIDHGAIAGLSDNDHTQYVTGVSGSTPLRGGGQTLGFDESVIDHDALTNYSATEHVAEASIDHGTIAGLADNDHTQYVTGISGSTPLRGGGQTLGFDESVIDHNALTNYSSNEHFTESSIDHDVLTNFTADEHFTEASIDHGSITGLADDDHPQYVNNAEMTTISGDLQTNIDGKSDTGHNHSSTDVTDWQEGVDDAVNTLLVGGNNITLTYDDGSNTLTISGGAGGDGVSDHGALTGLSDDDHPQYVNNSEMATISGDLQTNIDALTHDGFADYVTNDHIDWTGDAGADNMHDNNIVASNVTQHEASIDHDALTNFESNEHFTFASVSGTIDHNTIVNNHNLTTDINHNTLTNYAVGQHRIINDSGTSATELWSASQIESRVVTATGSLTTDHGNLSGLTDDDHTQYHTDARGDARYYTEAELDAGQLDNRYHTEAEITTISGDIVAAYIAADVVVSTAYAAADTTISGDLQTNIDALTHDGFADYVTNEHIDWTGDAGADNIHDNNIVASSVTQHEASIDHGSISGMLDDDHTQYILVDGTRAFTGVVGGISPTAHPHLATKEYVDDAIGDVLDYHFNNTASDIDQESETTYDMVDIIYSGEENITRTAITATSNQLLYCFATLSGQPGGID